MNKTLTAIALATAVVASATSAQASWGICVAPDRIDTIETCGVKDQDIAKAMEFIVEMAVLELRQGMPVPWFETYCQPTVTGFKCTYKGITQIYRR
jgi:hypothetical protein